MCCKSICRYVSLFVLAAISAVAPMASDARADLIVTNGDFESSYTNIQDVPQWFDQTTAFKEWINSTGSILSDNATGYTASQHLAMGPGALVYQSLGAKTAGQSSINWSFFQGRFSDNVSSTGFAVTFYAGAFTGADDVDITGVTQIGSTASVAALGADVNGRINSGSVNISGVADGTEIWLRIASTEDGYAPIDNISVSAIPEPSSIVLLSLGLLGLLAYAWRKR